MRWRTIGLLVLVVGAGASRAWAGDDEKRVLTGVISGLLGQPGQSSDAAYTAQERDRLVSLLQSGEYVTSRQGEPIELMVYGIPLTRTEHVYTARPVQPSQAGAHNLPRQ